jgi:hypothetical protein
VTPDAINRARAPRYFKWTITRRNADGVQEIASALTEEFARWSLERLTKAAQPGDVVECVPPLSEAK